MSVIEMRPIESLRGHPENAVIFGDPEECPQWESILASIRKHGILEPLVIKRDGTILSGHLRRAAAEALKLKSVPARVVEDFASYRDELEFVVRSNTDRRQLTKAEIALAFKRLRETPRAEGGTRGKRGRPEKNSGPRSGIESRAEAANLLGVGEQEARALETVFTTPGVPEELKRAVNSGVVAPTPAAKAVRTELKRQGGEIKDQSALKTVAEPAPRPQPDAHEKRVADEAEKYRRDFGELFELYKRIDGLLTRRPLKSVIGPTEHIQYAQLIKDVAIRAWREIESVEGPTDTGKQMTLTVIRGGAK